MRNVSFLSRHSNIIEETDKKMMKLIVEIINNK